MRIATSDETRSLWMHDGPPAREPLPRDEEADVVVVGAGITGLTTAFVLSRAGKRVIVLDAGPLGHGETLRSTAHLTQVPDARLSTLVARVGKQAAALTLEAHAAAIDYIETLVRALAMNCEFSRVPGYLFVDAGRPLDPLEEDRAAAEALGLPVERVSETPLPFPVAGALRFEGQAQLHPGRYLAGLLLAAERAGVVVYERTRVLGVDEGPRCRVETDRGVVTGEAVVVAAHVPVVNRLWLHTKLAPYRSYVIAVDAQAGRPPALFWDTDQPYHYWRLAHDGPRGLWLIGGEDHKVGHGDDAEAAFDRLEGYARARLGDVRVRARWSGQVIEPADGLPYIGRNSRSHRVFVATGFSGNGITGGTLAALVLADEVEGKKHPWGDLFEATRVRPRAAARAFVRENADVAKHMLVDRFRTGDPREMTDLRPGDGRVVDSPAGPLAVYRSPTGHLNACSAVCTHLGCVVNWNNAENTWDCPCHGSRYDPFGNVLNGPAVEPLARRNLIEQQGEEEVAFGDDLGSSPA